MSNGENYNGEGEESRNSENSGRATLGSCVFVVTFACLEEAHQFPQPQAQLRKKDEHSRRVKRALLENEL